MPSQRVNASPGQTPPTPNPSHYQLLGLPPAATAQELRQAFRRLSKLYHPDTTTLPAPEAREAFARLRQAYAVLADADSRQAYDAQLRRQALQPPVVFDPPLPVSPPRRAATPIGVRRSLSGGEWFALVLLAVAMVLCLILGFGLAWARGAALVTRPSWWVDPMAPPSLTSAEAAAPLDGEPRALPPVAATGPAPLPTAAAPDAERS